MLLYKEIIITIKINYIGKNIIKLPVIAFKHKVKFVYKNYIEKNNAIFQLIYLNIYINLNIYLFYVYK